MFNFLKKKKENKQPEFETETKNYTDIEYKVIFQNDTIGNVGLYILNENRREFIENYISIDSLSFINGPDYLEHSNSIMQYKFANTEENNKELNEILPLLKDFNSILKVDEEANICYLILSGSVLVYKNLIENCSSSDNKFFKIILSSMYNMNKCYFSKFINNGIMSEYKFIPQEYYILEEKKQTESDTDEDYKKLLINIDNIDIIKERIDIELSMYELIKLCSISFFFKRVPLLFIILLKHPGCKKSLIPLLPEFISFEDFGSEDELQSNIIGKYKQKCQEDDGKVSFSSMSLLPLSSYSSIYMTFTFKSLLQILSEYNNMKSDDKVIQYIKDNIISFMEESFKANFKEFSYDFLLPRYKTIEKDLEELEIDEYIDDEITEEIVK